MKKVFLDTNIFIDILTKRPNLLFSHEEIDYLLENFDIYISTLTVHITFYITKIKPKSKLYDEVTTMLEYANLIPLSEHITLESVGNFHTDFEDTLQYYSALKENCDYILTRDKKDFRKIKSKTSSKIQIIDTLKHLK